MTSPSRQVLTSTFWQLILTPYSSPHIQAIRKSYVFTCNVYSETIHFSPRLLLTFCFKGPLFLRFYFCSPSISTPCRDQSNLLQSQNGHPICHSLIKSIAHLCLPFMPKPLTMIWRTLWSMSPSNSLNHFHSLTSVPSSWPSHWFCLQFSYSTQNMPALSCLRASAWMQKSSTIRILSSRAAFMVPSLYCPES